VEKEAIHQLLVFRNKKGRNYMTDHFFPQLPEDIRRVRNNDDDVERDIDRNNERRGRRPGREGQPWYDEPHRPRRMEAGDANWEGGEWAAWQQAREQEQRWGRSNPDQGPSKRADYPFKMDQEDDWWEPGPYEGLGPRGYRRSDANIEEDVCDLLTQHGKIDASDIEVKVENGEVTLTGKVNDRRSKRLAEDLAESISGVTDVHNHLRLA
jgi:hypothetical protein